MMVFLSLIFSYLLVKSDFYKKEVQDSFTFILIDVYLRGLNSLLGFVEIIDFSPILFIPVLVNYQLYI